MKHLRLQSCTCAFLRKFPPPHFVSKPQLGLAEKGQGSCGVAGKVILKMLPLFLPGLAPVRSAATARPRISELFPTLNLENYFTLFS
ncbi:UNVERIFIED_CONTAM: hypothetical protein K2H54_061078 [Gekko kuhli]